MNQTKVRAAYFFSGGFFLLDRILKFLALNGWRAKKMIGPMLGWEPFANGGAAFGLPVPNWLIAAVTVPMIGAVAYLFFKSKNQAMRVALAAILLGALSNLFDRLAFGYVVDYFRVLTGVINLGDIMIIVGLILLVKRMRKKTTIAL